MSGHKPPTKKQLERQCAAWNAKHQIGTAVRYHPVIGRPMFEEHVTSSEAQILSGHTAVVWLVDKSGCVALDACEAIPAAVQSLAPQQESREAQREATK